MSAATRQKTKAARLEPSASDTTRGRLRDIEPTARLFADDATAPNNPDLPFLHYPGALDLAGATDPAAVFEALFAANDWRGAWRNGVYDFVHYHPRTHEVLGVARGTARVRFGGGKGAILDLQPGDVAVLPAGTGHQALDKSADLIVVGAYPPGGEYEEFRDSECEHTQAKSLIPATLIPEKDPVYGAGGPLTKLWSARGGH